MTAPASGSGHIRLCAAKIPRDAAVANTCKIPLGAVVEPFSRHLEQVVKRISVPSAAHVARCSKCFALASPFCDLRRGPTNQIAGWRCALCGTLNAPPATKEHENVLLGQTEAGSGSAELRFPPMSETGSGPVSRTLVLVVDSTLDADQLDLLRPGLVGFLRDALRDDLAPTSVALVTYGSSVRFHRLAIQTGGPVSESDAFPARLQSRRNSARADRLLAAGRSRWFARVAPDANGRARLVEGLERALLSVNPYEADGGAAAHERPRCMVGAIALACRAAALPGDWSRGKGPSLASVLVLGGGWCTAGPGAVPGPSDVDRQLRELESAREVEAIAEEIGGAGSCIVDILGCGHVPLDVTGLYPLTQNTGGCLLTYEAVGDSLWRGMRETWARTVGVGAVADFRVGGGVRVDRICGPVVPWPAAARPPIGSAAGGLTDNAVGLTSCERGVGVCLSLRMLENVSRDSCFLQGEFYYADLGGERRLRVVTERMAATSSGREFLLSVDPVVCGVHLAKTAVLDARRHKFTAKAREGVCVALERRVREICENFCAKRREGGGGVVGRVLGARRTCDLGEELASLAEFAYFATRTPALSPRASHHPDERASFATWLLRCGVDEARRMVWPRATLLDGTALPACDAALGLCPHFALDCGGECLVWASRREAEGGRGDGQSALVQAYRDLVLGGAGGRFPCPDFVLCQEGSPEARRVVSRLVPTRQDSVRDQGNQCRALLRLSEGEREAMAAALLSTYHRTDEPSFREWCAGLGLNCGQHALG